MDFKHHRVEPIQSKEGLGLKHACWMVSELSSHPEWEDDKTSRWIGYIQAMAIMHNLSTLEKERHRVNVLKTDT